MVAALVGNGPNLALVYEIVSLLILIVIVVVKCRLIGKIQSFKVENIVLNIQGKRLVRQIWRHSVCIYIIFELVG